MSVWVVGFGWFGVVSRDGWLGEVFELRVTIYFCFLYSAAQMQDDFISSGKRNHNALSENPSANKRRPRSRHNDV